MPEVLISFLDGEVVHATVGEITFDLPVIEAEVQSIANNCEEALFPLTAIRELIVGDIDTAPDADVVGTWDRAAFHFVDGQVMRASIAPDSLLGRHGGIWRVVEPGSTEMRTIAIPYTALKGVYRIREWDSRSARDRATHDAGDGATEHLARVLSEREEQSLYGGRNDRPAQPLMKRMRHKS